MDKQCQNCKASFETDQEDLDFYSKVAVPSPTWCPRCRLIRRMSWQGYRHLYKRKCAFTGEEIISTHHPDTPQKVYRQDIWWSDKWDPLEYGRDIDWSRPFLEQFAELMKEVPLPSLYTEYTSMRESDYCNAASECKNCYLCFRVSDARDSAYVNLVSQLKDCFDCSYNRRDTLSYENVITHSSYQTFFCEDVVGSQDMWFCRSCVGCHDCVATANVTKKKYMMFNEQKTKGEYQAIFDKYDFGSFKGLEDFKKKAFDFLKTQPRKHFNDRSSVDTTGEYIYNSKNVRDSYMVRKAQDLRYCQFLKAGPVSNSYDYTLFGEGADLVYESTWIGMDASNVKFCAWNYGSGNIEFCFGCHSSNNMFGCVGVRKGEYYILNKRYPKETYLELTGRIRQQMEKMPYVDRIGREYRYGEMLPSELCPWAYNESFASEWFPLTKEEAVAQGFLWRDSDPKDYQGATTELPDHIKGVRDDILKEILKCGECGKNYRIIKMELDFYRRFNLPLPRFCSLCRDQARTRRLNPMEVHDRTCDRCGKKTKSSWSSDRPEIVYCESCYQAEVA